ncbi:MFS efflux transporter aclA [Colletotrichum aenigma]|uniref:MFS efflux transporter aclA n=1 Tax=Colletotrichum aenigma TaxID=1215731 RepID=UPI00187283A3|nr:MFS efflux transporter aclA [Colletotrichum aenigma]KAF5525176.1 MFS efflux transporter aclA [Colletotrichum aenigma]
MAQFTDPRTSLVTPHEPLGNLTAPQTSTDQQVIENGHADPATPWKTQGWRFWAVFPGLCLAMLLTGLDASILATSLPTIVSDLHGGALYIWTMNGYFLTTAVVQPLMGQAAEIFDRRIPMLVALSLFTLGSGLCGGSTSLPMLIAARPIQGLGGGGLFVMTDTIIADLTPLRDRMKYVSMVMIFFTLGSFLGPIIVGATKY